MWREGQSFDDAFQYVKAARGIADPNMGFACQLLQCQKRVHAFPLSPNSLLRMYRIAPHSPYDPLHLVPKMLDDSSPCALDSRGEFIIHIPSAIYVWIGKKCEGTMERDARGAACQIVRYEKAIKGGFVPPFSSYETENETLLPVRESSWSVLRHKFASGKMKDFVSASTLALSRVYPDSMLMTGADNSVNKSLHSSADLLSSTFSSSVSLSLSSSSSSSPPYLSPDSISSDSSISSKYFSDSPTASPSAVPCSRPPSATLTSSSNLSLSSKISPQSITKTSEYIDVNFTSGPRSQSVFSPHSQSVFSPSKGSPLSIAERRGSLTKCLTLPVRTDDSRGKDGSSSYLFCQHDCISRNVNSCACEPQKTQKMLESKREGDSSQECELQRSSYGVANVDSYDSFIKTSNEQCINNPSGKRSSGFTGFLASGIFIFVPPSSGLGKIEEKILYFWVGKSCSHGKSKIRLGSNGKLGDLEEIDWNQDTNIKIVTEDEEPVEFLALLGSL
ncbi:Phosphoric monoester hydrolase [Sarracenia purpurea var. burkii]